MSFLHNVLPCHIQACCIASKAPPPSTALVVMVPSAPSSASASTPSATPTLRGGAIHCSYAPTSLLKYCSRDVARMTRGFLDLS